MKTLTLKKLSTAVLAATCILGVGIAQAVPKVSITLTTPKGTAGANANAQKFYKDLPWLPCAKGDTTFGGLYWSTATTGQKVVSSEDTDQMIFELSATNEDVGTSSTVATKDKLMDFDLYVFFIDPSNAVYALRKPSGGTFTSTVPTIVDTTFLKMITNEVNTRGADGNISSSAPAAYATGPRDNYLYLPHEAFGTTAAFSTKLLGGPIELNGGKLKQGMWSVMAIFVSPDTVTNDTDGAKALQNPQNWEAWTIKPFIVGTPFLTNYGTTVGTTRGSALVGGNGYCF